MDYKSKVILDMECTQFPTHVDHVANNNREDVDILNYDSDSSLDMKNLSKSKKIYFKNDINLHNIEFEVSMIFVSIDVLGYTLKIYEIRNV